MIKTVSPGKKVPDAALTLTGGKTAKLSDYRGRHLVLYFYPRDNTPGCTSEGEDFRDQYKRYKKLYTEILGVSRDNLAAHEKFRLKYRFPFDLVSDEDEHLCQLFNVIKEKTLYGKKHLGVERSTFIIDREGVLRREFRGVKVLGHVQEVLEEIEQL